MTDIIDSVQLQEVGDSLVDLYDFDISGELIYLFGGLEDGTASIFFPNSAGTLREYFPFPIEMTGVEQAAGGASARPTLVIANLISLAELLVDGGSGIGNELAYLGITKNEDLVGSRVTRRRTLVKYLNTPGTPVEFPKQSFVLDRISSENNISVDFELASPFDISGFKLPSRIVVGKYCPWKYQGGSESPTIGACTWPQNSKNVFHDIDDNLLSSFVPYVALTPYVAGNTVRYDNKIWECIRDITDKRPDKFPAYWKRVDVCGKIINSCKIRFQGGSDTSIPLPFGGFPGSSKFR
jgi:lambda family phage minor tail protein L